MADRLSSDLASLRIDRDATPPKSGRVRWIVILAVLAAAAAAVYFLAVPYISSKVFKTEVEITEIAIVSPAQGQVNFTSTGYVEAQKFTTVSAKVGGRVTKSHVRQGDVVKAGDVLLELDRINQESAVRTARARVAAAQAAAQTARAQVIEGENQAKLARDLATQGIGAKAPAVDAEARVTSLRAAVRAADAQTHAAQQEVKALEIDLTNYQVLAPIGGTVTNKPPELGEMVGPSFGGIASQLGGIEITDFDSLTVVTDVPEARLHLVEIGGPCEAILDAYPQDRTRCKVVEILPRVNRAKATVPVRVAFVGLAKRVLPDMAARVSFLQEEVDEKAIKEKPKKVVPRSAVADRDGAKVIFQVEEGRVRMLVVQLGPEFGDGWELKGGPDHGTKIVANPSADLADGQKVKEKGE